MRCKTIIVALIVIFTGLSIADMAQAVTAETINVGVEKSLDRLKAVNGGQSVIDRADGLLVFPSVFKAGFVVGGEYGEGALVIDGKSIDYYSTAAASFGFQLGAQKKTIILAFMDKKALENFRNSTNWKIGADASVAVIAIGADGSIDTSKLNQPIVAFVFDPKGLMYNLTLEGAKVTKLTR